MAQITSREELRDWLKDKPVKWAQVVAIRAALRALPYAFTEAVAQKWVNDFAQLSVQMVAIRWIACNIPKYDMTTALRVIYKVAREADLANVAQTSSANAAANFCYSAIGAIFVGREPATFFADAANVASHAAAAVGYGNTNRATSDGYAAADADITWDNISADCAWLAASTDTITDAQRLARERLWPHGAPQGWGVEWLYGKARLLTLDRTYQVWIDWYNRRIEGHEAAFDIPGDTDCAEDKAILVKLADTINEDFWDKGATHVNTTLQRWIDEARERAAEPDELPSEPDSNTIAAITAPLASPDVIARNNQLDVIPNAILDVQSDTLDLAEAIAVLRSLVGTLRPCLSDNISPIFVPSLARYDEELEQRRAKPFIGVLARMEEQIEAQFNAEPDAFEAGVGINFKSYFAEHHKFMTHYHNHLEREKVIAELKIDERAASGKALTSAFDAAARTAEELFNQGLATDGYRNEFIAQQQGLKALEYSQDTAGNKRAKMLQIVQSVGFLQQTLIASATIVATVAALPQFITAVEAAIAALSKLFV